MKTKIQTSLLALALSVSGAFASGNSLLTLYGGTTSGDYKGTTITLRMEHAPQDIESGAVGYVDLNYQSMDGDWSGIKRDYMLGFEMMLGYQVGTSIGGFQILPLGLSWNYLELGRSRSIKVYHYNIGIGYKNSISDSLTFKTKALYNLPIATMIDDKYLNEDYNPKGFSTEVGFDYAITKSVSIGLKATYQNQKDNNIEFKKGLSVLGGISYIY